MQGIYALALMQTHAAVERFSADSVATLRCKPGYEQRGAVCQPIRQEKGIGHAIKKGALTGALIGAGKGIANYFITRKMLEDAKSGNTSGVVNKAALGLGINTVADVLRLGISAKMAGSGLKNRIAGALASTIAGDISSAATVEALRRLERYYDNRRARTTGRRMNDEDRQFTGRTIDTTAKSI